MPELDPALLNFLANRVQEKTGWGRDAAEAWVLEKWEEKTHRYTPLAEAEWRAALERLEQATKADWKAAAWALERRGEDPPIRVKLSY